MLITDKELLKKYRRDQNLWVGIPSIEVTKGGYTYLVFYSGGVKEDIGNYSILLRSKDGKNFGEPIAVCYEEGYRCYDPCVWIDPLGRLWLTWSRCPDDALFGAYCEDPDADELTFCEEFFIGHNVMMNKPTVLSSGEWLFPIAVWAEGIRALPAKYDAKDSPKGAFAYVTYDCGKTFTKLGGADVKNRCFDEHMFLELGDGTLRCFVRTFYGIGAADSFDAGAHWSEDFDTGYGGPSSRFHIRRLASGRVLLINHHNFSGRNNLTAMLSEDDGKTFPYKLLLDERSNVSYPDAAIDSDGMINITYDRERGGFMSRYEDIMNSAREILTAKICEEDIIAGKLVNEKSYLKHVAYKLTEYNGDLKNPFNERCRFDDYEYACYLQKNVDNATDIISNIFEAYNINCSNIHNIEAEKLDGLIEEYQKNKELEVLNRIISLVRNAQTNVVGDDKDTVNKMCKLLLDAPESNTGVKELSKELHFSEHYLRHIFKKRTGMSVGEFKNAQRIKKAKLMLKTNDSKITEIASACGFENPSYFAEVFTKQLGVSPTDYRKAVKR